GLDQLPVGGRRSMCRIVRESLADVLRRAPGAPCVLGELERVVDGRGDRVEGRITNELGPVAVDGAAGTGRGILGMRERAASLGGSVEAGAHERGWQVRAVLPLAEPDANVEGGR